MSDTTKIENWLKQLAQGNNEAINALVGHTYERLRILARETLRRAPQIRRWEETDDLCQQSLVRFIDALHRLKPGSVGAYCRLAAFYIHQTFVDLTRHYLGPQGLGRNYATDRVPGGSEEATPLHEQIESDTFEPSRLNGWTAFHEEAEKLPEKLREVLYLRWYGGHEIKEIAEITGESERTVKRHWRQARLHLYKALQGERPES